MEFKEILYYCGAQGLKPRTLVRSTIQKLAGKASIAKPRALARG